MKFIDWLVIGFFILASAFTLNDLFLPDFYTSHDGVHQVVRLYYFDQAIQDGQIPPRWAGGLQNGFGYPLFLFSYHFPWFIAEPLHLAGMSIFQSIKMTFLIGYALSGITMYLYLRSVYGRAAAFLGSGLYLYAPYRFSNIFVRAAIGDATAFLFFPLIFLALYKIKESKRVDWRWICLGAFAQAGLLLSHAMVFFLFELVVGCYLLLMLWLAREKKQYVISSALVLLFGLGLSAYYFIPSLLERSHTKFATIMSSAFTDSTYVPLSRLLYDPWGYGMMLANEGGMSLQVGIAQFAAVGVAAVTLLWYYRNKRHRQWQQEGWFFLGICIASIFMMQPSSSVIWQGLRHILVVDFTWRILVVPVFAAAVLTAYIVSRWRWGVVLGFLLLGLAIVGNRNHLRINEAQTWDLPFYLKLEKTTNSFDEYTPLWVDETLVKKPRSVVEWSSGDGIIDMKHRTSNLLEFTVHSPSPSAVLVNTIYYPGWTATRNGKHVPLTAVDGGRMSISVPTGVSLIRMTFRETPLRLLSDLVTILSALFLAGMLYRQQMLWKRSQ